MKNNKLIDLIPVFVFLAVTFSLQTATYAKAQKDEAAKQGQVFSIHPDNPRCFLYKGKPFKILTSAEHYGAVMNTEFDYAVYLKEMKRTGQNQTRVFTFYRELWGQKTLNTLAVNRENPQATIMPWRRAAGRGKGPDGLDKFDLDQ